MLSYESFVELSLYLHLQSYDRQLNSLVLYIVRLVLAMLAHTAVRIYNKQQESKKFLVVLD